MKSQAKVIYEKMVDFKRFAIILLATGSFLYLGILIPSDSQTHLNTTGLMIFSLALLAASAIFFLRSKKCQSMLLETEDGEEYLSKK
ncbi:MAG: YrhC family protein [Bacillota bacterium]|nr:YrhC family protein [Bacillota bacterium]